MNQSSTTGYTAKWPRVFFTALLILAFFIPWVSWDQTSVTGADMPLGHFFGIAETDFRLANPFPQLNFVITALWLIPAAAAIALVLSLLNKKASAPGLIAGILALSAVTVYILFTNVLVDLGVKHSLRIGIYITILAAGGIILAFSQGLLKNIVLFLAGPVVVWIGFSAATSYLENEEFGDTANIKADYTVNAIDLIREFQTNDSMANAKYSEKILAVNGAISAIDSPNDSTVNIKFIDSTTGSYAIFPFTGEAVKEVKILKQGDTVSLKGSCSGGVLSRILRTLSITFKRCTLN